jgi:hypothetical protein
MSWGAVDDGFHSHRKVLRLRRSQHYAQAVALWTLSLSWCCDQEQERFTGTIPCDVLNTFGIPDWFDAAELLSHVGLWEPLGDDAYQFHDWGDWNGIDGKEFRSKEQARLRQQAYRKRKCEGGTHTKDCPPETCPKKVAKDRGDGASRDAGSGRDGSGRDGLTTAGGNSSWRDVEVSEIPA